MGLLDFRRLFGRARAAAASVDIAVGAISRQESMSWRFSALPDACDACRQLDGEEAPHGSGRWIWLSSLQHGCALGPSCQCGCAMIGVASGQASAPAPIAAGYEELWIARRHMNDGRYQEALALVRGFI